MSTSSTPSPADSSARRAARPPSVAVESPRPAMRRSLMPVRSVIHWSLVSTRVSRSAFVSTNDGTATPSPMISAGTMLPSVRPQARSANVTPQGRGARLTPDEMWMTGVARFGRNSEGAQAEQDLTRCHQLALPGQMGLDPPPEVAAHLEPGSAVAHLAEQVAGLHVGALVGRAQW